MRNDYMCGCMWFFLFYIFVKTEKGRVYKYKKSFNNKKLFWFEWV